MDQAQRVAAMATATASRAHQFHPARSPILDLFNLYLGRHPAHKNDDSIHEPPNKTQKRVLALRDIPPPNEQFLVDFEQLQSQFPDQDQLRSVTETIIISLVLQCSSHGPRAEFLLFAIRSLCTIGCINWDTLLPSLLASVSSAEFPVSHGTQSMPTVSSSGLSHSGMLPPTTSIVNSTNFQSSNNASPLPSIHPVGSPAQSTIEPLSCSALSPVKSSDVSGTGPQSKQVPSIRNNDLSSLRQLCCKIILTGLESNLKPAVYAEVFHHMLNWLVNWDQRQQGLDESDLPRSCGPDKALTAWLHSCLDVIWLLVDEGKCRVPFYELLRSSLQFIDNIPDDEALFTLILEIHRRRDMMAMNMQMLDQHLHCPTFGTQRILNQATLSISGEPVAQPRQPAITYLSVLGEPLHGEDIANSIQKGSLDWERALRCLRHAFRTTPSPDWWRRVLLVSRLTEGDHPVLKTNHVTWLLAQIIRMELVTSTLNPDAKKVDTTRKILSVHRDERNSDPNGPQSTLLEFISSCQCLRIWSLNTTTREYVNSEQLQKGKQIDEWWKQVSKGDRMLDYMNMDDRSMGMFWVLSYTMAQPTCETVMNWLTSAGIGELPPQTMGQTDRLVATREVSPLPMSLLSGLSLNLCGKLSFLMEDALFAGQVIPSIAMVETYTRLLLVSPHSLFRSHFNGPTEFTETLNRAAVVTLAILIKTRGVADADHLHYLQSMLEQTLATSHHTWSEKTLRFFPTALREALSGRVDHRGHEIKTWQQGRVLKEFSPEEVTGNIYTMVDVLLHHMQMELQQGHSLQDLLSKACASIAFFVWTHELLPLDILLLALIDRDDDPHALRIVISLLDRQELQQRVKLFCITHGPHEHWLYTGVYKRVE
ncbi:hypothetical protein PIB30_021925, partial [Stylosanthes scabra]|nr:hypothetical protein [Stylosanthes scabra]